MSAFCSEVVIRKAADWRAFKQGRELIGSVIDATATDSGWRGTLRDGRRPIRVSVIARTAIDIEARCSCRENQSTGVFCAHAVAVGLFLAEGKTVAQSGDSAQASLLQAVSVDGLRRRSTAWGIHFPPPWQRMLSAGKLAVRIMPCGETPDAIDERLCNWLSEVGIPDGGTLQLDGDKLADFLRNAVEHSRIFGDGKSLGIRGDALFRIASVERKSDWVVIRPESSVAIHVVGNLTVEISENEVSLISRPFPRLLAPLTKGKPAELPLRSFLELVEPLGDIVAWPEEGWLAEINFVFAEAEISIALASGARGIEARPRVSYGDKSPVVPGCDHVTGLPELAGNSCLMRNHRAELEVFDVLGAHGFKRCEQEEGLWCLTGDASIGDFLNEGIAFLQARYAVHYGPGFAKRMRETAVIRPHIEILGSGEDWLSFNLSFESDDSPKALDSSEVWRLLKTGGGGESKRLARDLTEVIDPLFSELDLVQENGRFVAHGASVACIQEIHKYLSKTNNKSLLSEFSFAIPSTLKADLRPYQLAGAGWMWNQLQSFRGVLLADDMGLGKTLQAIAVIERLFESIKTQNEDCEVGSVLVVATASLMGNWRGEFGKFAPGRCVRILHGVRREDEKEHAGAGEVWLTTYGTLSRDLAWYLRQDFLAVVVDEASLMRNPDTDHAKAIFKLKARNRIAMSGTPVENGIRDLWSIFRFIQPGWLGGRQQFKERYEAMSGGVSGCAVRRLKIKTSPFMLRRTKEEVAPELPAKILIDEFVDLSRDQQAVYRELLREGRRSVEMLTDMKNRGAARMQMLTTLLRLRQACCDLAILGNDRLKQLPISQRSSKLERLLELIEEATASNHKILVFSQFTMQLHEILKCIESRNIKVIQLDGSSRNRHELVERFQSPAGPSVFLISLKAGGYGLNLTAADVVIHYDPWWNPAAEAQATDRAHRIGQTRPVTVYRLLTRGTVEEKVVALQRRKLAVAAIIDEVGIGDAPGWDESELAALLD